MRKLLSCVALMAALNACSDTGGMYKEGDPQNGTFSAWRTIALPFAVLGIAAVGAAVGAAEAQPTYTYRPVRNCTTSKVGHTFYTNCY
jgi:hypothetical protein